jgi:4-hydroxy-tetrahydrodipicolinate synthase
MTELIRGVLPIVHTPFADDDSLDVVSLRREVDWEFGEGIQGVCTGMVSELLRLSAEERRQLTEEIVQAARGRGVVIIGVGAESTRQAVAFALHAERSGATGVMAIPPVSTSLAAGQLGDYFRAIADSVDMPLIIQDASGYVGQQIPLEICVELLDRYGSGKILFKPEASPIGPQLSRLRDATSGAARIFEGSGGIALIDSYRRGIRGTMPGMEFLPGIVALWRALERGDEDMAYRLYFPICALVALQLQAGLDGFLAVEKYVLVRRGLFATSRRRTPWAWSLDEETRSEVDRLLARLDDVLAGESAGGS